MIPIISHGEAGEKAYTYEDFESHFLEICESHRAERRALAFAFILYDFRTPQIAKALRDRDYWRALDEISGKFLSVFSFHRVAPQRRSVSNAGRFGYMTSIETNNLENGIGVLENYFDLNKRIKLPAIIFFQVAQDKIIGSKLVQLTKETTEESYIEMKKIISCAADSVSRVTEENYNNAHAIFHLIEDTLSDRGIKVVTSSVIDRVKSIKEVLFFLGI